ncbi:MAG TPA: efflux RND transporter periplasmic adaptor subunit [Myxococcales bacterium]
MNAVRAIAVAALLVLGAGAAVLWHSRAVSAREAARIAIPAPDAQARRAARPPGDLRSRFVGTLFSRNRFEVNAAVEGMVGRIDVSVGEAVARGSLLVALDSPALAAEVHEAEAALRIAQAESRRRGLEVREQSARVARLRAMAELISAAELEAAGGQLEMARAQLQSAEAAVAAASARLRSRRAALASAAIRAPFDGVVAEKLAGRGSFARVGTPLLRIVGAGDLGVRFAVPEDRMRALEVGGQVLVEDPGTGERTPATVKFIAPEVDPGTHAVFAEASLDRSPVQRSRPLLGLQVAVLVADDRGPAELLTSAAKK